MYLLWIYFDFFGIFIEQNSCSSSLTVSTKVWRWWELLPSMGCRAWPSHWIGSIRYTAEPICWAENDSWCHYSNLELAVLSNCTLSALTNTRKIVLTCQRFKHTGTAQKSGKLSALKPLSNSVIIFWWKQCNIIGRCQYLFLQPMMDVAVTKVTCEKISKKVVPLLC